MGEEDLSGSVALITGAGSGIGEATARRLAEAGLEVICAGRRLEKVKSVAAEVGGHALALDVVDPDSVDSIEERLPAGLREVSVLVNSAGHDVGGRRRFDAGSADHGRRSSRPMSPPHPYHPAGDSRMLARNRGHVVNIGSIAGLVPYKTGSIYAASKHAVHGFSESLRQDFAGTGVRVSEILPGMVRTEFALNRWKDEGTAAAFYDDYGICLAPDDIARAVLYCLRQPPPRGHIPGRGDAEPGHALRDPSPCEGGFAGPAPTPSGSPGPGGAAPPRGYFPPRRDPNDTRSAQPLQSLARWKRQSPRSLRPGTRLHTTPLRPRKCSTTGSRHGVSGTWDGARRIAGPNLVPQLPPGARRAHLRRVHVVLSPP